MDDQERSMLEALRAIKDRWYPDEDRDIDDSEEMEGDLFDFFEKHSATMKRLLEEPPAAFVSYLEQAIKLVAFYQGEGEHEIPEEAEYGELARIPREKRTEKQAQRLVYLANFIMDECDAKKLREERDRLRGLLNEAGIDWKIPKIGPLDKIRPIDIPRGLDPEDVATDS